MQDAISRNALEAPMSAKLRRMIGENYQAMKMERLHSILLSYSCCVLAFILLFSYSWYVGNLVTLGNLHLVWKMAKVYKNSLIMFFWMVACLGAVWCMSRPRKIYMLDFACFKPAEDRKCPFELAEYFVKRSEKFSMDNMLFQKKVFEKSGVGEETYIPPFIFKDNYEDITLEAVWEETSEVIYGAVDELMHKLHMEPDEIGIIVTVCSVFNPIPSLASHIMNRYKMKEDTKCLHLAGMGCSSGVIGIDLASSLLKTARSNTNALVVITENISHNWYFGNNKSMLVTNCLFRMGCAALILSNNSRDRRRAKLELIHSLRTHTGANEMAYRAAFQEEDDEGNIGIALKKELVPVASEGLQAHITALAPLVLPFSERLRYLLFLVKRRVFKMDHVKPYFPNLTLAFEHFCIHTGGKAVINSIGKHLRLNDYLLEPARMVLHRFGNTSCSLVLYELAYMEAKNMIKKGDRIWMVSFGTGFKCNTLVWKAVLDVGDAAYNPWNDCIHRYPVKLP